MPTHSELIKRRIEEAEKAQKDTDALVKALQVVGFAAIMEWIVQSLDTDDGNIKYTSSNLGKVAGLYAVMAGSQKSYLGTLLQRVLTWTDRIFGTNQEYFSEFSPTESLAEKARRLTLQKWGYDTAKKKLIPGGYFEYLFDNQETAQRTARLVNQAIIQQTPLKEFQKLFKGVFVGGKDAGGLLERHWKTVSFDLYQRVDRTANLVYADELGLNFAVYSGTLEEDSRPFCITRVNKVFSREEILKWKDLTWAGKPKIGYDPFTDVGGHNCRHHLSWISNALAELLKKKQG